MKNDDFRYMRRGKQLAGLNQEDFRLLGPIDQRGTGTDHALLILHGFSSSPAVYRYLIPKIENYDAIVCPVLPGHGESIEAFSQAKAEDWQKAANEACAELIKNYDKVDVLGLSLGGLLACDLGQHFTLNHLYLLAPAFKLHLQVNPIIKLAQVLRLLGFYTVRNAAGNLLNDEYAEIAYRKLPISAIIEMLTLAQQYQWKPPTCPVDLFLGTYDEVIDSKGVAALFDNLSNVNIHWLKNSAHVLPLEKDMQEIVQCINQDAHVN